MKNLCKVIIVLVVLFSFQEAKAQGEMSVGAGVVYGTNINKIGFSVNGKYQINDEWSAAPSYTLFLSEDYAYWSTTWSTLDLDANYQLPEFQGIGGLYAIGGLGMTFVKTKYKGESGGYGDLLGDSSFSETGVNLGIGMAVPASDQLIVCPEIKYTVGGYNFLRIGVKVLFGL